MRRRAGLQPPRPGAKRARAQAPHGNGLPAAGAAAAANGGPPVSHAAPAGDDFFESLIGEGAAGAPARDMHELVNEWQGM